MKSRRVGTVLAILFVFGAIAGSFLGSNSRFEWASIAGLLMGVAFPFAVMMMRVRGRIILAAFVLEIGLLLGAGATAWPAWLSSFGEASECEILATRLERPSAKKAERWHYTLQCGDRRLDSVTLTEKETDVGDVGDRTTLVFDRYDLVAFGRPENLSTTGYWLLPLLLLVALGFVGYAATSPIVPFQPRRSAKQQSEAKPVDQ
ncbi:hypothetical protein F4560_005610 [Saccharothrix ecbatanensis]|uniref:Uncharacterized protein n=1 Tax=Saccharothrix ecbatanensis TaxID=1105145 RepID=A0A7W9M3B3_9PSEU|nr:hypothetical protein [Saccharothrix ecbatanensis]MBB5805842.1 hypothetical protein [Saccharothrix ecbatanensis]